MTQFDCLLRDHPACARPSSIETEARLFDTFECWVPDLKLEAFEAKLDDVGARVSKSPASRCTGDSISHSNSSDFIPAEADTKGD